MNSQSTLEDALERMFSPEGPLSDAYSTYEKRDGQLEMSRQILSTYEKDQIALIEAGTGIGKSLAYLIPAILWAVKYRQKTVISTYTIALQEQLIERDIPMVLRALNVDLKAILVKGMSNYLCTRKLEENWFEEAETESVNRLTKWASRSKTGSLSEFEYTLSPELKEKIQAKKEECNHVQCPHFKNCFFFKARKSVEEAHLIVVNHHLLFADLLLKKEVGEEKAILPAFDRLILDEAHRIDEVAVDCFSRKANRVSVIRQLNQLHSDVHPERSISGKLREKAPGSQFLELQLPVDKRLLIQQTDSAFKILESIFTSPQTRIKTEKLEQPLIREQVSPSFVELSNAFERLIAELSNLQNDKEPLPELSGCLSRLDLFKQLMRQFFQPYDTNALVRWIDNNERFNTTLIEAPLEVATHLKELIFEPISTVVLCSATLTTNRQFSYVKAKLGIDDRPTVEGIYDSPFDYAQNALFAIPSDLPDPSDPQFTAQATAAIEQIVTASNGGAFVLFTSYEMLANCYRNFPKDLFPLLKQGDRSRQQLLEMFKNTPNSVLFATDSFWEGIDVPGDALRCVIIVKLPFKVPSDPINEAESERFTKMGKDPFMDSSVPHAILKFKQGFGRLIRTKNDRGAVVCLDRRLIKKGYGKQFLASLPKCKTAFEPLDQVTKELANFYAMGNWVITKIREPNFH